MATDVVIAKPLNATQQKNLQLIVDMDHNELSSQVRASINQQLSDRQRELDAQEVIIRNKYSNTTALDKAKEDIVALARTFEDQVTKLTAKLYKAGFSLTDSTHVIITIGQRSQALIKMGLNEELAELNLKRTLLSDASSRISQTANNIISRSRVQQNRGVLASTIESTSKNLLDGIPKAEDILKQIETEVASVNKDDLLILSGEKQLSLKA